MNHRLITLDGCTPLRQTLSARPPAVLHFSALGLALLLAAGVAWAALTRADLVVRASGRVRPVTPPVRLFAPANARLENRVLAVHVAEGSRVQQGQVLLQFDTERATNEIARAERTIQTGMEECQRLDELRVRLREQFDVAQAKATLELAQARSESERSRIVQQGEVRQALAELTAARDKHTRHEKLAEQNAIPEANRVESETNLRCAEEKLALAQVPLVETRLEVLERALALVERDHEVRLAELEQRRTARQGEVEAALKDLENLELQRRQATLTSPCDGVVISGQYHPGDLIESGKTVFEVATEQALCFESFIATEDVGRLRQSMPARIKFDAFDFQRYGTLGAEVAFIAPDSRVAGDAAQKSPVYVVRLRLDGRQLMRGDLCGDVKLGLAGQVEIVTERRTVLEILIHRIRSAVSLG